MMRVYLEGIGLFGPGLEDWAKGRAVLAGRADYMPVPLPLPPPALLPANERRRAPAIVKLALATCTEAFAAAGRDPATLAAVFTSSGGDGDTIHEILGTLASAQRELSPTRFHNSVHNTAAGYWSIATGAKAATTSLCCHDGSFAAGLLEAAVQAAESGTAVVLAAYDAPYPAPLAAARPISAMFGAALLLTPVPAAASFARIDLALHPGTHLPTPCVEAGLEALRRSVPAARGLPLLAALAGGGAAGMVLEYLPGLALWLDVAPRPAAGWKDAS